MPLRKCLRRRLQIGWMPFSTWVLRNQPWLNLPADIALDRAYRAEWLRRMKLVGMPGPSTLEELDAQIVADAAHPVLAHAPRRPISQEMKLRIKQSCLSTKQAVETTAKDQNA